MFGLSQHLSQTRTGLTLFFMLAVLLLAPAPFSTSAQNSTELTVQAGDDFAVEEAFAQQLLAITERLVKINGMLAAGEPVAAELEELQREREELASLDEALQSRFAERGLALSGAGLPQVILSRHRATVTAHTEQMTELESHLSQLETAVAQSAASAEIGRLVQATAAWLRQQQPAAPLQRGPAAGEELPFQPIFIEAARASLEELQDRVLGDPAPQVPVGPPQPADLNPTVDVEITQDIIDLAASLNNDPLAIYRYVRDNFDYQPYLGSRKGSLETLSLAAGNDYDQASLLIALLRAANIPARYVSGNVYLPAAQAMNWVGVDDAAAAANLLATAGKQATAYYNGGGQIAAIGFNQVWVAAYLPTSDYRGIGGGGGDGWVPMDPSMKSYTYTPGIDVPAQMGFNAENFVDTYITSLQTLSPVEKYLQDIETYVQTTYPGLTYPDDIWRGRQIAPEELTLLPATLPYTVLAEYANFAVIPTSDRHQIRFHITDNLGGTMIDQTLDLPAIAGKRVTIAYEPATPADQATIASYGDLYATPPDLINLKPVLKIGGTAVITGTSIGAGTIHNSDIHFLAPAGESNNVPVIYNQITAGTYQAVGLDTFRNGLGMSLPAANGSNPDTDALTGEQLYRTAMAYLDKVDASLEQVAHTMQMAYTSSVSDAIVENVILVSYGLGGNPISWNWRGLVVDADRRIIGSVAVDGDSNKRKQFMVLTGADGSYLENAIFEDRYQEEAVSTIKILTLASDAGIPICKITTSIATDCPALNTSSSVLNAINNALAQGREITIPESDITYYNWSGTGYITMDPATGAAGYIISGGQNGGATVDTWGSWGLLFATIFRNVCSITANILEPADGAYFPYPQGFWARLFNVVPPRFRVDYTVTYCNGGTRTVNETFVPHFLYPPDDYTFFAGWGSGTSINFSVYDVEIELPDDKYAPVNGDALPLQANITPRMPPGGTIAWSKDGGAGDGVFSDPSIENPDFSGTTEGTMDVKVEVSNTNGAVDDTEELQVFAVTIEDAGSRDSDNFMAKGYSGAPVAGDVNPATIYYKIDPPSGWFGGGFTPKEVKAIVSQGGTAVRTEVLSNGSGEQEWQWDGKDDAGDYVDADVYQIKIEVTAPNDLQAESTEHDLTVVEVTQVEILDSSGGALTANNHPNQPGGVRIFPGQPNPGNPRNDTTLVRVTLNANVPAGELDIFLNSYDVADPTGLIDDNDAAATNGVPQEGELSSRQVATDGDDVIEVDFRVTMQPGDNFKVFASSNEALINNLTDTIVENNIDLTGATTDARLQPLSSERLTVWRYLHVERDSMEPVTSAPAGEENILQGNITDVDRVTSRVTSDVTLRDGGRDLDKPPPNLGNGRFESGLITVTVNTFPVDNNGEFYMNVFAGLTIPYTIVDSGGGNAQAGDINDISPAGGNTQLTVNNVLSASIYAGGNLTIDGTAYPVIINTANTVDVTGAVLVPYSLIDDDTVNDPAAPDVSHLAGADNRFAHAYVEPVINTDNNNVSFVRNSVFLTITGTYDWDDAGDEDDDYWAVYLLGAFQFEEDSDNDPTIEPATYGVVDNFQGDGANIFMEIFVDNPPTTIPGYGEPSTVAHEIGHLFDGRHNEDGIMCSYANHASGTCVKDTFFGDDTLQKIRTVTNRP